MNRSSPVRLALVSHSYPPVDGGVATSTQRVARNLVRLGCEVLVLTFDYGPTLAGDDRLVVETDQGVEVRRVGPFYRDQDLEESDLAASRRRAFDQMEALARAFQPTILMSFFAANAAMMANYLSHALGLPHVAGLRGNDVGRNIFSTQWLPILGLMLESAAGVVCVNEHIRRRLQLAFPGLAERSIVVPNGIQLPAGVGPLRGREYLGRQTGWRIDDPVAVFIGTPREKKGIRILLRAMDLVPAEANLRLLFVGPSLGRDDRINCGQSWDALAARSRLHVTGYLERASALRIAAEADIVVMPSIDDGLANGLLEGMALGLCPVVSDVFADVVQAGRTGWVVRRSDAEALARALTAAALNRPSREQLASAANRAVEVGHSPLEESEKYLELFQRILGAP